jgi:hypothetical protein
LSRRVCIVVALVATAGCRLDPLSHDRCDADGDCALGRVCVAGHCQAAPAAGADAAALPDAEAARADVSAPAPDMTAATVNERRYLGFRGGLAQTGANGLSYVAPATSSPRAFRTDRYIIGPSGMVLHGAYVDLEFSGFVKPLGGEQLTDGLDATSFANRSDVVGRARDGALRHATLEMSASNAEWRWQRVGDEQGRLRPALAHLGQGRLVAFQAGLDGKVRFAHLVDGAWGAWTPTSLTATVGLDATTLQSDGEARSIRLVSLDESGRPVMAAFTLADGLGPWTDLGAPPGGAATWPSIATFGQSADQFDIFVTSKLGSLWRRSFPAPVGEAGFTEVPGTAELPVIGAIDVAAISFKTAGDYIEILCSVERQIHVGYLETARVAPAPALDAGGADSKPGGSGS